MLQKNNLNRFIILLSIMIFLIPSFSFAQKYSVGVSPSVLDLGEVERGSSKIVKFFIVTTSETEMLVQLETSPGSIDFFSRDKYRDLALNYSEEYCDSWIEFIRNPVELKPGNETIKTPSSALRGWKEIKFILKVPEKAEPGYHLATITPMPLVPSIPMGPVGISIRTAVNIPILFKVPGDVIRQGKILDVASGNYQAEYLEVNVYFQNTGTTTISARADSIEVYDKYGRLIETLTSTMEYVKPGETKILRALWDVRGLDTGDYDASTTVCYTTDCVSKESVVNLYPPKVPITYPPKVEEYFFPWWLIISIIIIVVAYIIYRRS